MFTQKFATSDFTYNFDIEEVEDRRNTWMNVIDPEYEPPKPAVQLQQEESRNKAMYGWHQIESRRRLSFGGSSQNQFSIQPMAHNAYGELYFKKATLRRDYHVFAFVWFQVKSDNGYTILNQTKLHQTDSAKSELSRSLLSTMNVLCIS